MCVLCVCVCVWGGGGGGDLCGGGFVWSLWRCEMCGGLSVKWGRGLSVQCVREGDLLSKSF